MFNLNKFKAQMALRGMTGREVSQKMGINEATFYRKLKDNGNFNRQEINNLIDILGIESPEEIFFADELA